MILLTGAICYVITRVLTEEFKFFQRFRVFRCAFCTSFWVSFFLVLVLDYHPVSVAHGGFLLEVLLNSFLIVFVALVYRSVIALLVGARQLIGARLKEK